MSSRNNQQRRVARRFKRHLRVTQHHQRGRVDAEMCVILGLGAVLVLCALTSIAALCVALDHAACTSRIDWSAVPVETPSRMQPAGHQAAFKRERQRMYAALAFERSRPQ